MASDYRDRKLSFWQRSQMRLHLFICHHCRRFLTQYTQVNDLAATHSCNKHEPDEETVNQQVADLMKLVNSDKPDSQK